MEVISSGLGNRVDDAATVPAVLHVEGLRQDADLREFVQSQKEPGGSSRRVAQDRIIRIHAVDANVRPTWTHAINRDLCGRAIRKYRWSTAGCWSNSRLQDNRLEQIAAVYRKFGEGVLSNLATDCRSSAIDVVDVPADSHLL